LNIRNGRWQIAAGPKPAPFRGWAKAVDLTIMSRMSNRPIYLDYQATTPMDQRVLETMSPFFLERFGNPHASENLYGQDAATALEDARAHVASLIGADPREIVFTAGATEANNLILQGVARRLAPLGKRHIITCATEHKSVLDVVGALCAEGFDLTVLGVQPDGRLDLNDLAAALRPETGLVSVMAANNEIGVLQPLAELASICRARGVLTHSDAAQAVGKTPFNVSDLGIDYASLSAHKLYGPMGVGAAYVRRTQPIKPQPLFRGGGQEGGLRPGSVPLALCVGFGAACELAAQEAAAEAERLIELRGRLIRALEVSGLAFSVNGSLIHRLPGNLNISIAGVDAEALLMTVRGEIAIASGSACTAGALEPSYVVSALGFGAERAEGALRLGLGRMTTETELDRAANCLITAACRLQRVSYSPNVGMGA
jgi:cysteine desulfurase